MPKTTKISNPIDRLAVTVNSFVGYCSKLPPERLKPSTSSRWETIEVLVHLVFWHEQYASITKAILSGKKPELLTGTFKELNAYAIKRNKNVNVATLINRWLEAERQLERATKKAGSKNIKLQLSFREGSKIWSFEEALDRIEKHIRGHLVKLKKHGKK